MSGNIILKSIIQIGDPRWQTNSHLKKNGKHYVRLEWLYATSADYKFGKETLSFTGAYVKSKMACSIRGHRNCQKLRLWPRKVMQTEVWYKETYAWVFIHHKSFLKDQEL